VSSVPDVAARVKAGTATGPEPPAPDAAPTLYSTLLNLKSKYPKIGGAVYAGSSPLGGVVFFSFLFERLEVPRYSVAANTVAF
jgi:hypothetical protein